MLPLQGTDKPTKCCKLTIHLVTGVRIEGTFHVPVTTGSSIRPSDALRDYKDGFLILTDATVHEATGPRQNGAIMIHANAISHIDLPDKSWAAREAT
jgi:hypothetical protein